MLMEYEKMTIDLMRKAADTPVLAVATLTIVRRKAVICPHLDVHWVLRGLFLHGAIFFRFTR